MLAFVDDLYDKMTESVNQELVEQENVLQQAEHACHVVGEYMLELKQLILAHVFQDNDEEIYFFKEEKPRFLNEFIYYSELFYIESNMPVGKDELQKGYLERNLVYSQAM